MIESRDWTAYNAAQSEEKGRFVALLSDLCRAVPQPEQTRGRPRLALSDMVFASAYKVYVGFSARRFTCDLREAEADGLIGKAAHFNSVNRYLANPDLTPILKELVTVSSLPLKAVETDFAVDATGFSTCTYERWRNAKYGGRMQKRDWFKAHIMVGVKTNVVTAVDISGRTVHDSRMFVPLLNTTAEHFALSEVSADRAYLSREILDSVDRVGATPFIPFKTSTAVPKDNGSIWARMYHLFMFNRESYLEHFQKRSNVESAFSMIKGKFGPAVRSKSDVGQVNEVLCKVLYHNICTVARATRELGVETLFGYEPAFGSENELEPKLFL